MGRWITKNGAHVWLEEDNLLNVLKDTYPSRAYNKDVEYITKIKGKDKLENEFGQLKNDDVVLTEERKRHIKERRKDDFDFVMDHLNETLEDYDYLLKDDKDKAIFIKSVKDGKHYNNLVVLLSLNDETKANSILTGIKINDKNMKRYLNNHKIIDKKK